MRWRKRKRASLARQRLFHKCSTFYWDIGTRGEKPLWRKDSGRPNGDDFYWGGYWDIGTVEQTSKAECAAKVLRGTGGWLSGISASNNRAAIFRMPLKTAQPMATQMDRKTNGYPCATIFGRSRGRCGDAGRGETG